MFCSEPRQNQGGRTLTQTNTLPNRVCCLPLLAQIADRLKSASISIRRFMHCPPRSGTRFPCLVLLEERASASLWKWPENTLHLRQRARSAFSAKQPSSRLLKQHGKSQMMDELQLDWECFQTVLCLHCQLSEPIIVSCQSNRSCQSCHLLCENRCKEGKSSKHNLHSCTAAMTLPNKKREWGGWTFSHPQPVVLQCNTPHVARLLHHDASWPPQTLDNKCLSSHIHSGTRHSFNCC